MSLRTVLGLSREANLMAGMPHEQRQALRDWRREKDAQGIKDRWPELPIEQLVFSRYFIEDTETGNLYREFGGDPGYASTVCAYYLRDDGWPVMVEPHDPPSRAEIEKRRAKREQRRVDQEATRKAHYDALRKGARR